jgi:hypothetical protein
MSDEFREATDRLIGSVTLADLAQELGVSHGLVRQARLRSVASSYRVPPVGWEQAVANLASKRGAELLSLANEMEKRTRGADR